MKRRAFLQKLGIGVASTAVVAAADLDGPLVRYFSEDSLMSTWGSAPAVLGDWAEYSSFSQFVIEASIDKMVMDTAAELGRQAGLSISHLVEASI